ncbi:MAG: hypothetical protein ACOYOK_10495 [Pseudobdellovibrionaceae bacterium]
MSQKGTPSKTVEQRLENMESLLAHSALGVHILFDNRAIADVFRHVKDDSDLTNLSKMKDVQDVMTALVSKKTYFEKVSYLQSLDRSSYEMLLRAYFHIVENTVRANNEFPH